MIDSSDQDTRRVVVDSGDVDSQPKRKEKRKEVQEEVIDLDEEEHIQSPMVAANNKLSSGKKADVVAEEEAENDSDGDSDSDSDSSDSGTVCKRYDFIE